jgi:sphinganine C4-monooxygenase
MPNSLTSPTINQTSCPHFFDGKSVCLPPLTTPFYYTANPSLLPWMSDHILALAAPVLAYWSLSLFFHFLDISDWSWLEKYRIHDSPEVKARNRCSRTDVVQAVIFQQAIQTALGFYWVSADEADAVDHAEKMCEIGRRLVSMVPWILGHKWGHTVLDLRGADMAYFIYWWGIPVAQFVFAMFVYLLFFCLDTGDDKLPTRFFIDTWQYFLHRAMHMNKFLYKHLHSVHHRLYVPYAFGALYNHPVEGFFLDSLGAAVAEALSLMTTRQAMLLFSFSTFKTVDDHCGYHLPFDPLQIMSGNNADYHDIHHQVCGRLVHTNISLYDSR